MAGDGHVGSRQISLASGEGGPALLWLTALYKAAEAQRQLTQRPSFTPRLRRGRAAYYVVVTGEGLVNLAASMPAIGINPKAEDAVVAFRKRGGALEVHYENPRKTTRGAAADVVIRAGGLEAKYTLRLGKMIMLGYDSTNPEEVEKAAHLLRLAGVKAKVGRKYNKQRERCIWYVDVSTDRLADKDVDAGLRDALVKAVKEAVEKDYVDRERARKWTKKPREGVTVAEDMPKFTIQITSSGGIDISYHTSSVEQLNKHVEALKGLGLEDGVHFTAEEPWDGKPGYLRITVEGVVKLAELSVHAKDKTTRTEAARWVKYLLSRARESG